ncbi:MAG: Na+-transporting NADH:ubiquinone oxidoreductase subunit F [Glaciecola sp.]|jgi:Na+-transporting NADH:ubiquinone oxidoreductase subunit F
MSQQSLRDDIKQMTLKINFKKIHKWVAVVVFIQLFIWLGSGFLLGKVDHSKAAGRDTKIHSTDKLSAFNNELIDIQNILKSYPLATHIELVNLLDMPVYRIRMTSGQHAYQASEYVLINAIDGRLINLASSDAAIANFRLIQDIAQASYKHPLKAQETQLMLAPIEDLPRERNPVWQINTLDSDNTSIYIRANTAQFITHVNDETRWRDLLLMLHFMDYFQEGSFNNMFIKVFGFSTLILSGSGLWWLYRLVRENQIKLIWWTGHKTVLLRNYQKNGITAFTASKNSSILSALLDNDIPIQAICGGGGVCGTCKFNSNGDIRITDAELALLTKEEIATGLRLSCQHSLSEVTEILIL